MTFGDRALSASVVYDHIVSPAGVECTSRNHKICSKELMKGI